MRWSKLKSRVEGFFAPSVAGREELRDPWYRSTGQMVGRGWMTLDGEEIGSFSDAKWWKEHWRRRQQYGETWEDVEIGLHEAGLLSRNDFYEALYRYLEISLEDAMASENPIARGLAMLDGRLGKRRLRTLHLPPAEHPLVHLLLAVRCEAEGVRRAGAEQPAAVLESAP